MKNWLEIHLKAIEEVKQADDLRDIWFAAAQNDEVEDWMLPIIRHKMIEKYNKIK